MSDVTAKFVRDQLTLDGTLDKARVVVRIGEFGEEIPVEKIKFRFGRHDGGTYIIQGLEKENKDE